MPTNYLADKQANGLYNQEYWQNRLLEMIKLETNQFVFTTLGRGENLPKNQGTKTISLRRYNSLPVEVDSNGVPTAKLAEGVAPTPLMVEGQKVSGSIDQFGAYIEETDVSRDIHFDDIKSIYQPELARHAAEVQERNIISKFTEASEYFCDDTSPATNDAVDDIGAADVLTFDDIRIVNLTMKNYRRSGHPRYKGKPLVVVHPNVMQDLLDEADLVNKMLTPGNDNTPIKLGTLEAYMIYGFYVIESSIIEPVSNTNSVNVYTSYVLGKEPYVVIKLGNGSVEWKMTGLEASKSDPLGQFATFGYKLWTGAKVIDPIAITRVYSSSGYDAAIADFSTDPIGRSASQLSAVLSDPTLALSTPDTVVTTQDITVTITDDNNETVTALDDAYYIAWSSSDVTKGTIAWKSAFAATITGKADGTTNITATLMKKTAAGDVVVKASAAKEVTVDVA